MASESRTNILDTTWFAFLFGGVVVSGVKYLSQHSSPAVAAILGAFPLGLISSYFIKTKRQVTDYTANYAVVTSILLLSILTYHVLLEKAPKLHRDAGFAISLSAWVVLVLLKQKFWPDV